MHARVYNIVFPYSAVCMKTCENEAITRLRLLTNIPQPSSMNSSKGTCGILKINVHVSQMAM